jgi:uncharacterized protein YdiU (UPF0061 family)
MPLKDLSQLDFQHSYKTLPQHFWQARTPEPLATSYMVSFNTRVAKLLDINPCNVDISELNGYMTGQKAWPGTEPLAMKYAGHQFGQFNPELGDGRGLLLGEIVNQKNQRWDLHLKGAGTTAFSRFGDGRAVLRSSIREYLMSEAMHGLNIPTTRALALLASTQPAQRETLEPCATLLRVTQCHIRFGHFEYLYYSNQHHDLSVLADYCIERFYPQCKKETKPYLKMFSLIADKSAALVAQWQAYGFVHGVLNTDNMSIFGETFDYGPYSFMDQWQWDFVANHSDTHSRYSYKNQPDIVHWNLANLAHSLSPIIDEADLKNVLSGFNANYKTHLSDIMHRRLGFQSSALQTQPLIDDFFDLVCTHRLDANRLLRQLSEGNDLTEDKLNEWFSRYQQQVALQEQPLKSKDKQVTNKNKRLTDMQAVNPQYILRNYMVEDAIQEAYQGDFTRVNDLLMVVSKPFNSHPAFSAYKESVPANKQNLALSCSS